METNNEAPLPRPCRSAECDFIVDTLTGTGVCLAGSGTCLACHLLEAEPSKIHDQHLVEATQKIKQILSEIPADPEGSELAFLVTKKGLLLGRVHHGKQIPPNFVSAKDDEETVAKALKLKN